VRLGVRRPHVYPCMCIHLSTYQPASLTRPWPAVCCTSLTAIPLLKRACSLAAPRRHSGRREAAARRPLRAARAAAGPADPVVAAAAGRCARVLAAATAAAVSHSMGRVRTARWPPLAAQPCTRGLYKCLSSKRGGGEPPAVVLTAPPGPLTASPKGPGARVAATAERRHDDSGPGRRRRVPPSPSRTHLGPSIRPHG